MVSIEIILMLLSLGVTAGVGTYVWRRPQMFGNTYQEQINLLRADLETTRCELNVERQESRANRTALEAVLKRNYQLYNEVQRMNEVVLWMRRQLADRNIELPPLPRELSESRLDTPGVAIRIDQSGVNINDSTVSAGADIVGGDTNIGGNRARLK